MTVTCSLMVPTDNVTLTSVGQYQARKAGRTGAPEPHCLIKGDREGREPIILFMSADGTPRDIATTFESAVDAFTENNGGFGSLCTMIVRSQKEVEEALRLTDQGWVIYANASLVFDKDIFRKLAGCRQEPRLHFICQETVTGRQTVTGVTLQTMRANAVFGSIANFRAVPPRFTQPKSTLRLVMDQT